MSDVFHYKRGDNDSRTSSKSSRPRPKVERAVKAKKARVKTHSRTKVFGSANPKPRISNTSWTPDSESDSEPTIEGPFVTSSSNPNAQEMFEQLPRLIPEPSTQDDSRDEICEQIYAYLTHVLPPDYQPHIGRIVGMFRELPVQECQELVSDFLIFTTRLNEAFDLLGLPVIQFTGSSEREEPEVIHGSWDGKCVIEETDDPVEEDVQPDEEINPAPDEIDVEEGFKLLRQELQTDSFLSSSTTEVSEDYSTSQQESLTADRRLKEKEERQIDDMEDLVKGENAYDYAPWYEKLSMGLERYLMYEIPGLLLDFRQHKLRYILGLLSFILLIIVAISSLFVRISWFYTLVLDAILFTICCLQSGGRYIFPDKWVDDLYLWRQYYFIVAWMSYFSVLFIHPYLVFLINLFMFILMFRRIVLPILSAVNLLIVCRWGIFSTPLFILHLLLVTTLVFVRKRFHGVYKHPYMSLANLTPHEIERRKVYDFMRTHPQIYAVKDFRDLESDPFFLSDANIIMSSDPMYCTVELKTVKNADGSTRKVIRKDRDVREEKVVPFKEVQFKHPHFYQAMAPLSPFRSSSVLVCEELVKVALNQAILKFGQNPPPDGLSSLTRTMAVRLHYFNLPSCPTIFLNSVRHAYNRYLTMLKSVADTDEYLQITSIILGLQRGTYGKFRQRWFLRNFWLPEDHKFRQRLAKFVCIHASVFLIPIYGYVWRMVPSLLQEKKATDVFKKLPMAGNSSVSSENLNQTIGNSTHLFLDNVKEFLSLAKRAIAGYSFLAYAQPLPATNNYDNMIAGLNGRLFVNERDGVAIGKPNRTALENLKRTVIDDLSRWQPLPDVMSREEWLLQNKTYSSSKKKMLAMLEDTGRYFDTFFVKWESYTGFKSPRIISNSDKRFLTVEGPVIKSMEEQLERLPSTLTGIPVSEWPRVVSSVLGPYEDNPDYVIYVSDISSFESSITPLIKDATENLVFDRLLLHFPLLAKKLRDRQRIRRYYKQVGAKTIEYTYEGRASGDARTYAGNTIVNHYLIRNLYRELDLPILPYFVSGDDSIFVMPRDTNSEQILNYYRQLGFSVKLQQTKVATSGFCGFNFQETSFQRVCSDPVSTILKYFMCQFPLNRRKYRAYLADQALCLLHEYPVDPVLRPAVEWVIRNVPGKSPHYRDWWQQQIMKEGNRWHDLLQLPNMTFFEYQQLHPEHEVGYFEQLAESFKDAVISLFSGSDNYHAMKLVALISNSDLGSSREIFNQFRDFDPYTVEYDVDMGYYFPGLDMFQARALGLISDY